jgi:putative PIN family toxin of toxin-antitoxin system
MRILLDNNLFVSSLISPHGKPANIVRAAFQGTVTIVSSVEQIERLAHVLARAKHKHQFTLAEAASVIKTLATISVLAKPRTEVTATSDPEDNLLLAVAIAGRADYLVTGDKRHLLPLGQFEGMPIITVAAAEELIAERERRIAELDEGFQ